MTIFALRSAIVGFFAATGTALITGKNAPAWLKHTEVSVLVGSIALAVLVVVVTAIRTRAYKPAVREVPIVEGAKPGRGKSSASNGIQVLGTFLGDDEDGAR